VQAVRPLCAEDPRAAADLLQGETAMKHLLAGGVLLGWLLAAGALAEDKPTGKAKKATGGGGYVHVVIFTLKKDAPAEAIDEVIADCHKMLSKISVVRSVKAGRPSKDVAEKVVKTNYDVGLLVLVDDFAGVKAYLKDPLHEAFVKKHGKHFDMKKLQVFDFIDQKKK
jgi:hypothetical protein